MKISDFVNFVDSLEISIKPKNYGNSFLNIVWLNGKNQGLKKARKHVQYYTNEKFPILSEPPKGVSKSFNKETAQVWLDGYNHPLIETESFIVKCFRNDVQFDTTDYLKQILRVKKEINSLEKSVSLKRI